MNIQPVYCWPPAAVPGDTVRLRSGGPVMTLAARQGGEAVVTYWRDGFLAVVDVPFAALQRSDDDN